MAGVQLPVPTVEGALGAIEDLGAAQDGARTVSLVSPSGSEGDVVAVLGGNESNLSDAFFVGQLSTTAPLAAGSMGQGTPLKSDAVFRYARVQRLKGTAPLRCEVGVAEPSGGNIANAILNGGQAGPLTLGTTNNTSISIFANDVNGYVQDGAGNTTVGTTTDAATTTVQTGDGVLKLLAGAAGQIWMGKSTFFSSVPDSIQILAAGVLAMSSATGNQASLISGAGLVLDAAAQVSLGASDATAIAIGGASVTNFLTAQFGTGGQAAIGSFNALYPNRPESVQIRTANNGDIAIGSARSITLSGALLLAMSPLTGGLPGGYTVQPTDEVVPMAATASKTVLLPAATGSGRVLYFPTGPSTSSGAALALTPNGTDVIGGGLAGAPLNMQGGDGWIIIEDAFAGKWGILGRSRSNVTAFQTGTAYVIAEEDDFVPCNTAGAVTVTLPANPVIGEQHTVVDGTGGAGAHNITVARNGKLINGAAADSTISSNFRQLFFVFLGGAIGWASR
jgi:hypothetical protein